MFKTFETHESQVRSYCRNFPVVFKHAKNAELFSSEGERFIDFFSGAGAMNFGHNNPYIKGKILEYLSEDNIIHALDMYTVAKDRFIKTLFEKVLDPKRLDYKVMFCGATGTNAVEAALKISRKNKQRTNVFAFSGAFHGMTLGSLSLTTDKFSREGANIPLTNVTFMPFCNQFKDPSMSLEYLEWALEDDHSGIDKPAAIFLETVQAEGGIVVADIEWLQRISEICKKYDIMMVCDDIQVGICRTGPYFSFERAGIAPDIVILSKSLSGFGLPMSVLLINPKNDILAPAEHNGTFRGNQLGFIGAAAAIDYYAENNLPEIVRKNGEFIREFIEKEILPIDERLFYRGIGMIWGIDFSGIENIMSKIVMNKCFDNSLVIERAGHFDSVLKIMPPLTVEQSILEEGLAIVKKSIISVIR